MSESTFDGTASNGATISGADYAAAAAWAVEQRDNGAATVEIHTSGKK
jgi:hypothetical protein